MPDWDRIPLYEIEETQFLADCRRLYEHHVFRMIRDQFPEYEERIAVGIAGEGSECYGFDDRISRDHDYKVSLCLWLTDQDYEKIGMALQRQYLGCIKEYEQASGQSFGRIGYSQAALAERRGVMRISEFYSRILRFQMPERNYILTDSQWFYTEDDRFAEAANGVIFRDDLGWFSAIRKQISEYYPERIRLMKLINMLHEFSQNGQSNYGRMMARKDYLTAGICKSQTAMAAMKIAFLLNRIYAPYYKWMAHSLRQLAFLSQIPDKLEKLLYMPLQKDAWILYRYDSTKINKVDPVEVLIEDIAGDLAAELKRQKLTSLQETFLEAHIPEIREHIS